MPTILKRRWAPCKSSSPGFSWSRRSRCRRRLPRLPRSPNRACESFDPIKVGPAGEGGENLPGVVGAVSDPAGGVAAKYSRGAGGFGDVRPGRLDRDPVAADGFEETHVASAEPADCRVPVYRGVADSAGSDAGGAGRIHAGRAGGGVRGA